MIVWRMGLALHSKRKQENVDGIFHLIYSAQKMTNKNIERWDLQHIFVEKLFCVIVFDGNF